MIAAKQNQRSAYASAVIFGTVLLLIAGGVVAGGGPARAEEYPSWADVENARSSETAKQNQVAELTALIAELAQQVAAAQAEQTLREGEYELAQAKFDEATYRADTLRVQADEAGTVATVSQQNAGHLAASLARNGSDDLTARLLLDKSGPEQLLYRLGAATKLGERIDGIAQDARTDTNTARALTAQADVAEGLLGELATEAEAALQRAITARANLDAKLETQRNNVSVMQAQLAVLSENRQATEAEFQKGEEARRAAEEARRAAEEAARRAAEAAGPSGPAPANGQGWTLPVSGWISDSFGPRPDRPVAGVGAFHYGTDIAASCGQTVYAASAGTVSYANWLGTYGNWVLIDHGGDVQTGYAHNSEILVGVGQWVAAGTPIALVGTTGASSGCHSHFEVRWNGARIDPQPFMAERGVTLG
nr:M23 family metallopeptidase [Leifsonia sp. Leaf325]